MSISSARILTLSPSSDSRYSSSLSCTPVGVDPARISSAAPNVAPNVRHSQRGTICDIAVSTSSPRASRHDRVHHRRARTARARLGGRLGCAGAARHHRPVRVRGRRLRVGESGLGTVDGRGRDRRCPRRGRGHLGPRAVLRRRQGEPGGAPARRRDPGPAARDRPRALGGSRRSLRRLDPRRLAVGARRLRRRSTGSDGRRPQRRGDQRRADPASASACAQRRERAQ